MYVNTLINILKHSNLLVVNQIDIAIYKIIFNKISYFLTCMVHFIVIQVSRVLVYCIIQPLLIFYLKKKYLV